MVEIQWGRYPLVAESEEARRWLQIQSDLGLAPNTIVAYGHGLEDYFLFCTISRLTPIEAKKEHIAAYVGFLAARPNPRGINIITALCAVAVLNGILS